MMRFKFIIFILFMSVFSFASTEPVHVTVMLFNSSCEYDASRETYKNIKTECPREGLKYIISDVPLIFDGPVRTKNNIVIEAPSIIFKSKSEVKATSLTLNVANNIELNGEVNTRVLLSEAKAVNIGPNAIIRSTLLTKVKANDKLTVNGVISSAGDVVFAARELNVSGILNGLNSIGIEANNVSVTGQKKRSAQIISPLGQLNLSVYGELKVKSALVFSKNINIEANKIGFNKSEIYSSSYLKIQTITVDFDKSSHPPLQTSALNSHEISFNNSKVVKSKGVQITKVKYYKDSIWSEVDNGGRRDSNPISSSNGVEILSEGKVSIKSTSIISGKHSQLVLNGKDIDITGDTYLGNISGISLPDITVISKQASLDAYLAANDIQFYIEGEDSKLDNRGIVIGTNVDAGNIEGSVNNSGLVEAKEDAVIAQHSKEGKFENTGTIKGKNVVTVAKGTANLKSGKRVAAKTLIEVLPNSLDFTNGTGEVIASNIETHANLTAEGIYKYLEVINASEIENPIIKFFDTSFDRDKIIGLNKSIITDAGVDITSPNIDVLENVAIETNGRLALTARYGDLTLKHATKLKSKDQVLLFARNTIKRLARIKGAGDSAVVERSVVEAGAAGVKFHSGNYFDQAGLTKTSGTIIADIPGSIQLIPILLEHEERRSNRSLFGKKTRITGYAKFFGSHWEAQTIEGFDKASSVTAINFIVNGEKFKDSGIKTTDDQQVHVEHLEDVHYSYTEYKASFVGNVVRTVIIAVAAYYGGPEAGAAAAALTEPMVSGEVNLESMIKTFAISYAAANVGSEVTAATGSKAAGAIAHNLTVDAGHIILNGNKYTPEQFLNSVASGAISGGVFDNKAWRDQFLLIQKAVESAVYSAVSNVINEKSLELDSEFFDEVLSETITQSASAYVSQFVIETIDGEVVARKQKLKGQEQKSFDQNLTLSELSESNFTNQEMKEGATEYNNLSDDKKSELAQVINENLGPAIEKAKKHFSESGYTPTLDEFNHYIHQELYSKTQNMFSQNNLAGANEITGAAIAGPAAFTLIKGGAAAGAGAGGGAAAGFGAALSNPVGWVILGVVVVGGLSHYGYKKYFSESAKSSEGTSAVPSEITEYDLPYIYEEPAPRDYVTLSDKQKGSSKRGPPKKSSDQTSKTPIKEPVYTYNPSKYPRFTPLPSNQPSEPAKSNKSKTPGQQYVNPGLGADSGTVKVPSYVQKFKDDLAGRFEGLEKAEIQAGSNQINENQTGVALVPPSNPDDLEANRLYQAARSGSAQAVQNYRVYEANRALEGAIGVEAKISLELISEIHFLAGENGFSKKQTQELIKVYEQAAKTKVEIDALAEDIAKQFGGHVAKAPLKSPKRAIEKIIEDYGGRVKSIKDIARNTIVVDASILEATAKFLEAYLDKLVYFDPTTDVLGYSGYLGNYKSAQGKIGEIQINTPEMIFGKEKEADARAILRDELYEEVRSKMPVEGGLGHKYYKEYRVLRLNPTKYRDRLNELKKLSKDYWDRIREAIDGFN